MQHIPRLAASIQGTEMKRSTFSSATNIGINNERHDQLESIYVATVKKRR